MANTQRKKLVQRAYTGLAGSSLAVVARAPKKQFKKVPVLIKGRSITLAGRISSSDTTLKEPTKPLAVLNPYLDEFGQKHGEIDLDCAFQEYQFDRTIGNGSRAEGTDHLGSGSKLNSAIQDLGIEDPAAPGETPGYRVGRLPGTPLARPRRPSRKTWWLFDDSCLYGFIREMYPMTDDLRNINSARRGLIVLYGYYRKNLKDDEIYRSCIHGGRRFGLFKSQKEVKNLRQFLVKQGLGIYGEHEPVSRRHGFNCGCTSCRERDGVNYSQIRNGPDRFTKDGKMIIAKSENEKSA